MGLKKDVRLVREYKICDWCIRRFVNEPSDEALKEAVNYRSSCTLCHSIPFRKELIDEALGACSPYSFRTYNVSVRMDSSTLKTEDEIVTKYKLTNYIPLKRALREYFRNEFLKSLSQTLQDVRPELNIVFDFTRGFKVKIYEMSYQMRLNYIKFDPDAKVNASKCPLCGGNGCYECKYSGKTNDGSLESFFIYILPNLLNSTVPKITWALKDISGSTVGGNGSPVYLDFRSIYDRVMAPLMVPLNPANGVKFVLLQSIDNRKNMVRDFVLTLKIAIKLNVKISEDEIRKRFGKGELTVIGVEGKIWKKWAKILKFLALNDQIEITVKIDSGVNVYSWLGLRRGLSSKSVKPALFYENEVSAVRIDVLDVKDRTV